VPARPRSSCSTRKSLCEEGEPPHHTYFPHNIIISLMAVMEDGHPAEMSMFASESVTGPTAAPGTNQAVRRCVLQITGIALQINIDMVRSFMEALMVRVLQNMACKAIHNVEARCARFLLTCEFWAKRLGVQRSSIRAVKGWFRAVGWTRQSRGGTTMTDTASLRQVSCECDQKIHKVFVRLMPYTAAKH
jgi:hypothetical protein